MRWRLGSAISGSSGWRPQFLKDAIKYCESAGDFVTRESLEDILESEEDHIDWPETQLGLVEKPGAQNYLQPQV